jgi:hypothetical protein
MRMAVIMMSAAAAHVNQTVIMPFISLVIRKYDTEDLHLP